MAWWIASEHAAIPMPFLLGEVAGLLFPVLLLLIIRSVGCQAHQITGAVVP
jgi:hypothetical protein